jgi:hypothetical protein
MMIATLPETGGPPCRPPARTCVAADDDGELDRQLIVLFHRFDIPALFWPCFRAYAKTLTVKGGEFRARLAVLDNFRACKEEIRELVAPRFTNLDGETHVFPT